MKVGETVKLLKGDGTRTFMTRPYGEDGVKANVKRYGDLLVGYKRVLSGEEDMMLFSSPGRTEISGNRMDHNHGKALAGSTNLDCVGVAGKNESNQVYIVSKTYNRDLTIDLDHLEPSERKAGAVDLVKGPPQGFKGSGYNVGGFSAYITSSIISTAGISSSTSFEVPLCSILNIFFNESRMNTVAYVHIGKFVENNHWGKASSPLGQTACAVGGLITIGFMKPLAPKVEKIDFDLGSQDRSLIIAQTGKGHAGLGADHSAVPAEMKRVVRHFGKEVLPQASGEQAINNPAEVRQFAGDRPMLGALYFFEENKRVEAEALALKENRFQDFSTSITASGNSSWKRLQNCFTNSNYQEQGITVTLALTELSIAEKQRGACRIHGEDFAGIIMVVLPNELVDEFIHYTEKCMGEGNAYRTSTHPHGAIYFNDLV